MFDKHVGAVLEEGEAGYEGRGIVEDCVDGRHGLESVSANRYQGAFFAWPWNGFPPPKRAGTGHRIR